MIHIEKIFYRKLLYNANTNEIGQPCLINRMLLVYLGKQNIYKVYSKKDWVILGDL